MKTPLALFTHLAVAVFLAFFLTNSVRAQKPSAQVEKELIGIQNKWAAARVKRDVAFLEKLYAEEFRITAMDGNMVERAADIASFASGDLKPEVVEDSEMKVAQYGETAIVTGIEYVRGTYKTFPGEFWMRFTNVYVRRKNRWQMILHQSTEIRSRKKETSQPKTVKYRMMLDMTFPEFRRGG